MSSAVIVSTFVDCTQETITELFEGLNVAAVSVLNKVCKRPNGVIFIVLCILNFFHHPVFPSIAMMSVRYVIVLQHIIRFVHTHCCQLQVINPVVSLVVVALPNEISVSFPKFLLLVDLDV